jgi:hypothetical protein
MLKKIFFCAFVAVLPLFFFLEVWSVYSFNKLESDIRTLEKDQEDWVESNAKVITGIELFSSPARIEKIAVDQLHLKKIDPSRILKIWINGGRQAE